MIFHHKINSEGDISVIRLFGELIDRNQANELLADIENLLKEKKIKYVFDLSELKYMNSSGLNVLINILSKTRKEGGDVVMANVSRKVNELLVITKLNTLFKVTSTVAEGMTKINE